MSYNVDLDEVIPPMEFEKVPAGQYRVSVLAGEKTPNKKRTGSYLPVQLLILRGPSAGRIIFRYINVENPHAGCQAGARAEIQSLGRACGLTGRPNYPEDFQNLEVGVRLKYKTRRGSLEPTEDITYFPAVELAQEDTPIDSVFSVIDEPPTDEDVSY